MRQNGKVRRAHGRERVYRCARLVFVDSGVSLDSPKTITGATAANPVVITSPSHGFSNGDTVDIAGVYEYDATSTRGYKLSDDFNEQGYQPT